MIMEGRHTRSENTSLSFSELLMSIDDLHLESNVSSSALDENQNPNNNPLILLDKDFLGFFIDEDENKIRNAQATEGVVFCGKIIDATTSTTTSRYTPNNPAHHKNNKIDDSKKKKNSYNNTRLARRNSDSLCKYYSNAAAHSSSLWSTSRSKSAPVVFSGNKKEGGPSSNIKSSSERTSKQLACCSSKSRWEGFMFGSGRYPTKMELSDLRCRQLRVKHGGSGEEEKSSSAGKRMPLLIRVLGCVGGFDDDTTIIKLRTACVSSY